MGTRLVYQINLFQNIAQPRLIVSTLIRYHSRLCSLLLFLLFGQDLPLLDVLKAVGDLLGFDARTQAGELSEHWQDHERYEPGLASGDLSGRPITEE